MKTVRDILNVKGRMVWSVDPGSTVFDALSLIAEKKLALLRCWTKRVSPGSFRSAIMPVKSFFTVAPHRQRGSKRL